MKKMSLLYIGLTIAAVVWLGYLFRSGNTEDGSAAPNGQSQPIQVTASFYPLFFFTAQIAGDKATVYNLTPAGAEPHDYEPTTQDMARIENSRLLVMNGGKLEPWGDGIRETLKGTDTAILSVGASLADLQLKEEGETVTDPHVWLSPVLAQKEAAAIAEGLKQADPANAPYYETKAAELVGKLNDLDQEFRRGLESCVKKDAVTSHNAFGYLMREYGLNQVSISGLSPDEEPSPQQLAAIADFAKENNVEYIFFESLVSPKLAETIASEIGAETLVLNPLEGLSDEEINSGKNYFTEMQNNLANLKIALECR
ncbi:MAG: Manganese ABC transporter substrate-binding lipoprotein [Candidatus Magasanikbacteria bacterium GW2011_GWA2_56_11]|uniref:Manganese ABC transporter substrate-binding lipoprotein n=1 Tax=Candidatus Magasanikbacteria bacterium GW2011_GWA2_56_11 TaxID=1619044 RepID=A0A0G1YF10_9BACT|nr:MAG: Manganese ABC transporter substrate-binding lipoprotein [Candidatus Magasanikbacteria bacterium GW2011_GWA2_56_11]